MDFVQIAVHTITSSDALMVAYKKVEIGFGGVSAYGQR